MPVTINDTIALMISDDYKERFKAEYYQLKIRYIKLQDMVNKYDNGTLGFKPNCSINRLKYQLIAMSDYLNIMQDRAMWEDIDLREEVL